MEFGDYINIFCIAGIVICGVAILYLFAEDFHNDDFCQSLGFDGWEKDSELNIEDGYVRCYTIREENINHIIIKEIDYHIVPRVSD